jgi:site-specific DNA-methyltransferase (adenine-specific)
MGDLKYYGSQLEDILFCIKTREHDLRWNKRGGNLWSSSSSAYLPEGQFDHPAQKPERIISIMVENSSNPGGVVCDFHCGSGTTLKVCRDMGRLYFGCDINPDFAAMARERVRNAQPPLFTVEPEQMGLFE